MSVAQVSDQLEITDAEGGVRRVALRAGVTTLGSDPSADVRCTGPGIGRLQLRFVRTGSSVRVEPVAAGGAVEVNGERLFAKDLEPGDVIVVGDLELRWQAARPARRVTTASKARTTPAVTAARRTDAPRRRPRSRGTPAWLMVSGLLLVCVVGGAVVLKGLAGSTWPHGPQDFVDLAREQLGNGQPQRALDTLQFALRDASGDVRTNALTLQDEIQRLLVERSEQPKVEAARYDHDQVTQFEARYLRDDVTRPEAREFVRQCDQWLARHRDLASRHRDAVPMLQYVEQARARFAPAAALGEPETAADVLFAAEAHLRFTWREYPAALARLDAFLARTPDEAVRAERARLLADGEQWLRKKLEHVDRVLASGDRDNAAKDLRSLETYSVLPEWQPLIDERKARL